MNRQKWTNYLEIDRKRQMNGQKNKISKDVARQNDKETENKHEQKVQKRIDKHRQIIKKLTNMEKDKWMDKKIHIDLARQLWKKII